MKTSGVDASAIGVLVSAGEAESLEVCVSNTGSINTLLVFCVCACVCVLVCVCIHKCEVIVLQNN